MIHTYEVDAHHIRITSNCCNDCDDRAARVMKSGAHNWTVSIATRPTTGLVADWLDIFTTSRARALNIGRLLVSHDYAARVLAEAQEAARAGQPLICSWCDRPARRHEGGEIACIEHAVYWIPTHAKLDAGLPVYS